MKRRQSSVIHTGYQVFGIMCLGCIQIAFLSGCNRTEIHSYRVPKEFKGTPAASAPATQPQNSVADPEVTWTVPTAWNEVETTSSMRIATFMAANGQEIAVTAFPGDVGGLIANVNRWRGQVGLDSTDDQGVEEVIHRIENTEVIIVDVAGDTTRLIGSIINVGDGQTWFAKAIGPSESVGLVKDELIAFSKTFHVHDHAEHADHESHSDLPADSDANQSSTETTTSSWEQPEEWKVEENASSILKAAYNADGGARVTLTVLVGDGGGTLSNINRWRGQLGLPQAGSMDELQTKNLGNEAIFVDIVSEDESGRMAAGIVPMGNQTLFFKLTGSVEAVETELERFEIYINQEGVERVGEP